MTAEDDEPTTERRRAHLRVGAFRLVGFRAVEELCLQSDPELTVLLGENNTGKSSVLEAIGSPFRAQRAVEDDLHLDVDSQRREEFTIDLTLDPPDGRFDDYSMTTRPWCSATRSNGPRMVGSTRASGLWGDPLAMAAESRCSGHSPADGPSVTATSLRWRCSARPPLTGGSSIWCLTPCWTEISSPISASDAPHGAVLARLEVPPELETEISAQLDALGTEVIDASDVLRSLRERLQSVGNARGSSVSDVSLAPLPTRVEEVAQAIDVLVSAPGSAPIPLRRQAWVAGAWLP